MKKEREKKSRGAAESSGRSSGRTITISRSITIHRPASEVYAFWRNLESAATVLPGDMSVEMKSDRLSHWSAPVPGGRRVAWDAEVVRDEPNRCIAWRSCEGSDVANAGSVYFEPGPEEDRSTTVKLTLEYTPPGGRIGALVGKATRSRAAKEVADGLKRVRQRLEAGADRKGAHAKRP